jgi:hypothetical protein
VIKSSNKIKPQETFNEDISKSMIFSDSLIYTRFLTCPLEMLSFGSLFLGGRLIPFGGGNCFVLFPSGFGLSLGTWSEYN